MQVDRVVCRWRRTGEESCRPKMRLGGAIEASHRPWGALRRSFATLAPANRAEIAPRTGTVGKVTSLPFSSFNPDLKRVTHCRKKSRNRRRLPCSQIDYVGAEPNSARPEQHLSKAEGPPLRPSPRSCEPVGHATLYAGRFLVERVLKVRVLVPTLTKSY